MEEWMKEYEKMRKRGGLLAIYSLAMKREKIFIIAMLAYGPIFASAIIPILNELMTEMNYTYDIIIYEIIGRFVISAMALIFYWFVKGIFRDFLSLMGIARIERGYFRISLIFDSRETYNKYIENEILPIIYPKADTPICFGLSFAGYLFSMNLLPNYLKSKDIIWTLKMTFLQFDNIIKLPYTAIYRILFISYTMYMWILALSSLLLLFRILIAISHIKKYNSNLSITQALNLLSEFRFKKPSEIREYVAFLKEATMRGRYNLFLGVADSISRFLSSISIFILIYGVIFNGIVIVSMILYEGVSYHTIVMLGYSFLVIFIALIVFLYPQIFMTITLRSYKRKMLDLLNSIYEYSIIKFFTTTERKEKLDLILFTREIENAIDYAKKLRTYPFGLFQLIKIGSLIALILQMGAIPLSKLITLIS